MDKYYVCIQEPSNIPPNTRTENPRQYHINSAVPHSLYKPAITIAQSMHTAIFIDKLSGRL